MRGRESISPLPLDSRSEAGMTVVGAPHTTSSAPCGRALPPCTDGSARHFQSAVSYHPTGPKLRLQRIQQRVQV